MRTYFLLPLLILFAVNKPQISAKENPEKLITALSQIGQPKIVFKKYEHDFGKIKAGTTVSCEFYFKNTGNEILIISYIGGSAGVKTDWKKGPLKPGEEGVITVTFYPQYQTGSFVKKLVINNNTATPTVVLKITGNIEASNIEEY